MQNGYFEYSYFLPRQSMNPMEGYEDGIIGSMNKYEKYIGCIQRKRNKLSPGATCLLMHVFERNSKPNSALRKMLSRNLNIPERSVQIWFQNRRAKLKRLGRVDTVENT